MTCIFCDILDGKAAGTFVLREAQVAAILDIQPVNPGHLLVIPVRHFAGLEDLPAEIGSRMFAVAQRLAGALRRSGLRCEGIDWFLADGAAAMQEVFHVHLHVFPRFRGDGFGLRFPEGYAQRPPRTALEQAASRIRAALGPGP